MILKHLEFIRIQISMLHGNVNLDILGRQRLLLEQGQIDRISVHIVLVDVSGLALMIYLLLILMLWMNGTTPQIQFFQQRSLENPIRLFIGYVANVESHIHAQLLIT